MLGRFGYDPNNFWTGALFGSSSATISNALTGPDRGRNAAQLAVNSPGKVNMVNAATSAIGSIPTSGMGTVKLGTDASGRFFGVASEAATVGAKGAFKAAVKGVGLASMIGLAWDVGSYIGMYNACGTY